MKAEKIGYIDDQIHASEVSDGEEDTNVIDDDDYFHTGRDVTCKLYHEVVKN